MQHFGEFISNHWILWSVFIALLGMLVWSLIAGITAGIKQLNVTEFTRKINHDKAVVLDVREAEAYAKGHILNARHIPAGSMEERFAELKVQRDVPILVYCQTGSTSLRAAKVLEKKEFTQVYSLKGGLQAWLESKLPLSTD